MTLYNWGIPSSHELHHDDREEGNHHKHWQFFQHCFGIVAVVVGMAAQGDLDQMMLECWPVVHREMDHEVCMKLNCGILLEKVTIKLPYQQVRKLNDRKRQQTSLVMKQLACAPQSIIDKARALQVDLRFSLEMPKSIPQPSKSSPF